MPAVTTGTLSPGGVPQGHLTLGHSLKPWLSLSLQLFEHDQACAGRAC